MIPDDKRWDIFHKNTHERDELHSKYAEEKEILFPRNSVVVDFGGGTGSDALYFLEKGHSVIILDISDFALQKALARAKQKRFDKNIIVKQVDFGLHQIPIKANTIDVAYSRISLNYFGRDHTIKLFKDIYSLLKKSGVAFLTFKSPDDIEEFRYLSSKSSLYEENVFIFNEQLKSRFSREQLKSMLNDAGISRFEVKSYNEDLSAKGNHKQFLPVNEVVFYKS
jgi:ubiquinone/menaquinone biosynthesis C-methylase UbiE